jgi:hypothetical protein
MFKSRKEKGEKESFHKATHLERVSNIFGTAINKNAFYVLETLDRKDYRKANLYKT